MEVAGRRMAYLDEGRARCCCWATATCGTAPCRHREWRALKGQYRCIVPGALGGHGDSDAAAGAALHPGRAWPGSSGACFDAPRRRRRRAEQGSPSVACGGGAGAHGAGAHQGAGADGQLRRPRRQITCEALPRACLATIEQVGSHARAHRRSGSCRSSLPINPMPP